MHEVSYHLQCRECGRDWGNEPRAVCFDCFSPLEVSYQASGVFTREQLSGRPPTLWRYRELLPVPEEYIPGLPVGFTPLAEAPRLGEQLGLRQLYLKNDSVCYPTLSFKDRVVTVALARAKAFGFEVVGCSSTGNLANAVAAQAARLGLQAIILIPADLEPAKIIGTAVYGARLIGIKGNYDQVNRLCSQLADRHPWGLVNVNLRPYYAEGSKTVGYEIAEQLGWQLPDNIVVPMAGGSLITKIKKAFRELIEYGLVEPKRTKFFGAQAAGCSPISTAIKNGWEEIQPQKPATVVRSLAIGNPADGYYALDTIHSSGGWAEDASDEEIVSAIQWLAKAEGIFSETAGGVTVAVTKKLVEQKRIRSDDTTVLCITGNGLKTTDAVSARAALEVTLPASLAAFEDYFGRTVRSFSEVKS